MFNAIAPRYELINSLFSGGRDRYWRRKAVELARVNEKDRVLDIACGTGDFTRAFAEARPQRVVGCDFAHEMLTRTRESKHSIEWCECDALRLPFPGGSFSITSCAFGVRNWGDLDAGFREMHRVLKPGGRAVILEFSQPTNPLIRRLHNFYSGKLMPIGATLVSGDKTGAYHYLPRSVESFVSGEEMAGRLQGAGFDRVTVHPLTFGVVTVYIAHRAV